MAQALAGPTHSDNVLAQYRTTFGIRRLPAHQAAPGSSGTTGHISMAPRTHLHWSSSRVPTGASPRQDKTLLPLGWSGGRARAETRSDRGPRAARDQEAVSPTQGEVEAGRM